MPELPEVETIKLGLLPMVKGQTIADVEVLDYKTALKSPAVQQKIKRAKVTNVRRRGKALIIDLSNHNSLVMHFKMTGQLVFIRGSGERFAGGHPSDSVAADLPDNSTRVIFDFTPLEKSRSKVAEATRQRRGRSLTGLKSGDSLFFNDQRKFGWIRLAKTSEVAKDAFIRKPGPEPLSGDFKFSDFYAKASSRRAPIKAVIMDQSLVAGVGNIYADESLHMSKIHPATLANTLSKDQFKTLYKSITDVLKASIGYGGTSFTSYVNALGKKGFYLKHARVYKRTGKPCPVCKTPIKKIRVAGRGTHICPHCQKEPVKVR